MRASPLKRLKEPLIIIYPICSLHWRIASAILSSCLTCKLMIKTPLCSRDARAKELFMRGELINGEPYVLFEPLVRHDNQPLFRGVLCRKCGGIIQRIKDEESIHVGHFLMLTTVPSRPVNFTRPPFATNKFIDSIENVLRFFYVRL